MFLTIKQKGIGLYKEKGSKFIGEAQLCSSEKEAKSMILILRKQHPGCVHVCYAYRFGSDKKEFRYLMKLYKAQFVYLFQSDQ